MGPARRRLESQAKNSSKWQAKRRKVNAMAWANSNDLEELDEESEGFPSEQELLDAVAYGKS